MSLDYSMQLPWRLLTKSRSAQQVTARLDDLIGEIKAIQGPNIKGEKACDIVLVAHGHLLRAFVKRWLRYDMSFPLSMMLEPGGVGMLRCVTKFQLLGPATDSTVATSTITSTNQPCALGLDSQRNECIVTRMATTTSPDAKESERLGAIEACSDKPKDVGIWYRQADRAVPTQSRHSTSPHRHGNSCKEVSDVCAVPGVSLVYP